MKTWRGCPAGCSLFVAQTPRSWGLLGTLRASASIVDNPWAQRPPLAPNVPPGGRDSQQHQAKRIRKINFFKKRIRRLNIFLLKLKIWSRINNRKSLLKQDARFSMFWSPVWVTSVVKFINQKQLPYLVTSCSLRIYKYSMLNPVLWTMIETNSETRKGSKRPYVELFTKEQSLTLYFLLHYEPINSTQSPCRVANLQPLIWTFKSPFLPITSTKLCPGLPTDYLHWAKLNLPLHQTECKKTSLAC